MSPRGLDTQLGTLVPGRGKQAVGGFLPGCWVVRTRRGWASRPESGRSEGQKEAWFSSPFVERYADAPLECSSSAVCLWSVQPPDQAGPVVDAQPGSGRHLHAGGLVCLSTLWAGLSQDSVRAIRRKEVIFAQ